MELIQLKMIQVKCLLMTHLPMIGENLNWLTIRDMRKLSIIK